MTTQQRIGDLIRCGKFSETDQRPTDAAVTAADLLLYRVQEPFAGPVASMGDGGLHIRWTRGDRSVAVTVEMDGVAEVYWCH